MTETPRFTFAIITDTHVRAPGGDQSSPFPVNEKANGRARYAVNMLAAHAPDLTIHLGDVVHVLPHMPEYEAAANEARSILAPLQGNLTLVPGNHDIGDKPSPGMPAKAATADSLDAFKRAFGDSRHHRIHAGVHFVGINSSLVNSDLPADAEQRSWLEGTLAKLKGERIFLFSHYPPFLTKADEQDHYDNYAEPGRSWLLELAANSGVEAIFSGHVHHFFYNRYHGVKLFCLPPTSFIRQDYAEMFPVEAADEFGRDDQGKYSVCLIDVLAAGINVRVLPTLGRTSEADNGQQQPSQPQIATFPSIIPHLRHTWHEPRSLPYNGPMEEFTRKRVRNDYPLLRLLQLGMTTVRTPMSDLTDAESRSRLEDWASLGLRFVTFRVGAPSDDERTAIDDLGDAIRAVELIASGRDLGRLYDDLAGLMSRTALGVWLSKITTYADRANVTGPFAHSVSSGFLPHELDAALNDLVTSGRTLPDLERIGVVFQIEWGVDVDKVMVECGKRIRGAGMQPVANLKLSDPDPARSNFDDGAISRTLEAATVASAAHDIVLQCDTFEDVDRGYHPRHGFIDRRGNLRFVR